MIHLIYIALIIIAFLIGWKAGQRVVNGIEAAAYWIYDKVRKLVHKK